MPALEVLTWAGYVLAGFVAFLLVAHNPITPILRMHYGYKVPRIPGLSKASFVAIAISFQRLKK